MLERIAEGGVQDKPERRWWQVAPGLHPQGNGIWGPVGQWWQMGLVSIGPGWTVGCFPVTCHYQELLLPFSLSTAVAAFCYKCLKLQETDNVSSSVQVFASASPLANYQTSGHAPKILKARVKSIRVCSLMQLICRVALVLHTRAAPILTASSPPPEHRTGA